MIIKALSVHNVDSLHDALGQFKPLMIRRSLLAILLLLFHHLL